VKIIGFFNLKYLPLLGAITSGLLVAALFAWSIGLIWFANQTSNTKFDRDSHTDAIVVLTGGSGRLETGLKLLNDGLGKKLFVSGVTKGLQPIDLFNSSAQIISELKCCIKIGYDASNTAENAKETASWFNAHNFTSLRVVTASYHMPRSMMEFRRSLPNASLVANPIFPQHVKVRDWWYHQGTSKLIASEYAKFLLIMIKPTT